MIDYIALAITLSDMLFDKNRSTDALIKNRYQLTEDNDWQGDIVHPDVLASLRYSYFATKVESMENCGGNFNAKKQFRCISMKGLKNDSVILHEMITLKDLTYKTEYRIYNFKQSL